MTGITLHLIFLATSEDDYQMKFTYTSPTSNTGGSKQRQSSQPSLDQVEKPLEERDELISPRAIFYYILQGYKVLI